MADSSRSQGVDRELDLLGVGIGPSNLSVAALLEPVGGLEPRFFDRRREFSWHPGFLLPEATIQNSFLKDLVTLAAPSNPYSFLSFLAAEGRLYRFVSAGLPPIKRRELEQYYRWVARSLPHLAFDHWVEAIDHDGSLFQADVKGERIAARHLVLATGLEPRIPRFARPYLGPTVFHTSRFLLDGGRTAGRRIAIVGGGQSGAEVLRHLLLDERQLPRRIAWITLRPGFPPLDASPFTEEIFTPAASDFFFSLPTAEKERLLEVQRMASDGISNVLLEELYRRLYDLEFNTGAGRVCRLYPESELLDLAPQGGAWHLRVKERQALEAVLLNADQVILATGYEYRLPPCLEPLYGRLELDGHRFTFRDDFSVAWEGEAMGKIFVQNAARHCRGVPDPNLSLMAWRSAKIINSLAGRRVYNVEPPSSVFDWHTPGAAAAEKPVATTHG